MTSLIKIRRDVTVGNLSELKKIGSVNSWHALVIEPSMKSYSRKSGGLIEPVSV